MKCSDYVKTLGFKSLKELSEKSGVPVQNLRNWYNGKREIFDAVVKRVKGET